MSVRATAAIGVLLCVSAFAESTWREDGKRPSELPTDRAAHATRENAPGSIETAQRLALERGLAYLAKRQGESHDGSFPQGDAQFNVPVPVAALASLAFMAGGNTPDRGPQGQALVRALDYLLAHVELGEGSARFGYISSDGDRLSRMHGHGLATLALTQGYVMSPKSARGERTAKALAAAVAIIEKSQGLEGGWYYEPQNTFQHENSVTICLVQALRGAHDAGVQVDPAVITRAVDYVRRCQNEDGSFRYGLDVDENTVALTAASMATLNATGNYLGSELERGMQNLWQRLLLREQNGRVEDDRYPHYERFYVAQALWQHQDLRQFVEWNERERGRVIADQEADGSWDDAQFGKCYATAMNCVFLALPLGLLPAFQR